jgi:hypothetical protein
MRYSVIRKNCSSFISLLLNKFPTNPLAGEHKHYTDTAIITHVNNEPSYYGVSRYPPYIKKNGTQVYGGPNGTESQSNRLKKVIHLV